VKDKVVSTFDLTSVPREVYGLGLAGTLPYLATSMWTLYLSWNLSTTWPTESNFLNSFLMSHTSATELLQQLEPVQLGYGAVIISFLGAIHWGLEFGERTASRSRATFRYATGVLAPAVAWPTLLLPFEWGLTTQFAAFVGLYFADARATSLGWAPAWYGTYRFLLTFVVGAAIVVSLIARARAGKAEDGPGATIGSASGRRLSGGELRESLHGRTGAGQKYVNWERLEQEEKERIQKEKEEKQKEEKEKAKQEKKDKKGGKNKKGDKKEDAEKEDKTGDGKEDKKENKKEDDKEDDKGKDDSKKESKDEDESSDKKADEDKKDKQDDGKEEDKKKGGK
jgi:hypothetical protein